jgi:hypothetical protein
MGAPRIKRSALKEQLRVRRDMRKRAALSPGEVFVTVVQHETSKEIVGVAVSREAADRLRAQVNDSEHCELIDFAIQT